jgi:hypothetical protein
MKQITLSWYIVLVLLGFVLGGCGAFAQKSAGILQLREYQLAGAPELEPFAFKPIELTQEEVLAEHASDRAARVSKEVITRQGNPAISSLGDSSDMAAIVVTASQGQPEQTVRVLRGDKTIYETPAGLPAPVLPLQGLWTYNGHWALEILFADKSTWAGEVIIDGELVNRLKGYDEAFGLQLLARRPFFFFLRNGHVGYSYDGRETMLDYDEVPHYRCCSESVLNPVQAQNMVAFFAVREKTWFYVELGVFGE